ncbi:MAG: trigger factor [Candidatus Muiribacteriaceae bacterium]
MQVKELERKGAEGTVKYGISLPSQKVDEALERVYRDLVKRVNIPGFRKGKVPRKVLEVRVGKEYFNEEAKRILLEESYYDAVREIDEKTLDHMVDNVELEVGKGFSYEIDAHIVPEIEIDEKDYKGLEVEFTEEKYTDEKADEAIEGFLRKEATNEDAPDSEVQDKDIAVIDFLGKIDGEPFEGGKAEDYSLNIGSGSFIDNFEEQLIGSKVGDELEVKVTFPEDYGNKEYAGKDAVFDVKVKNIKKVTLPEINEEFLKKHDFESEEALREDFVKKTREGLEEKNKRILENRLFDALCEKIDSRPSEKMVDFLIEQKIDEFKNNIKRYFPNLSFEDYLKATQTDLNTMKENYREESERQAKVELLLKNVARKENIEVSDEEVEKKIADMAEKMGHDVKRLTEVIRMQGSMSAVRDEIAMDKTIELLKQNADIKEEKK